MKPSFSRIGTSAVLALACTGLAASSAAASSVHVVQPGDTMVRIARASNVSLSALEKANPSIHNPNVISVGQRIVVPVSGVVAKPKPKPTPTPVTTAPVAAVRTITVGYSVQHRPITAYEVGDPKGVKTLLLGQMHGNEHAGVTVANQIIAKAKAGHRVKGVDLWIIPTMNPDGNVHNTRVNADGVDLNRNFPDNWQRVGNVDNPGAASGSEPETKAMVAFLTKLNPTMMVSVHQPFGAVDTYGLKNTTLKNRLTANLHLPSEYMSCSGSDGVCHGTLTGWFNKNLKGSAETVEFKANSDMPANYLSTVAVPGLVKSLGGSF